MSMMGTRNVQVGFGWNAAAPLNMEVVTDEVTSLLMVRDVNGTPIVGVRLDHRLDGSPEDTRGQITGYTIVIPDESRGVALELKGAPWR